MAHPGVDKSDVNRRNLEKRAQARRPIIGHCPVAEPRRFGTQTEPKFMRSVNL
jgi:hypothetical protein